MARLEAAPRSLPSGRAGTRPGAPRGWEGCEYRGSPSLQGLRSPPGPAVSSPAEAARRKRGCVSDLNFSDFNDVSADSHKLDEGWSGVVAMRRAARTAL